MKMSGTSRLVAPVIASVATVFFISFASSLVGTPPTDGDPSGNVVIDSGALPKWVTGHQQDFAVEMIKGSGGLTDKVNHRHLFQYIYQPSLSRLVREKLSSSDPVKTIRLLEFGLGCHPSGGMINGKPGGSAFGWRHLFGPIGDVAFELYIFEFDEACAKKWLAENPHTVDKLLIGDASSEADLQRAYDEAGGKPFDVVIDDASHINWHQIKTLDVMLPRVAAGGFYVVEDIQGSCHGYRANMGSYVGEEFIASWLPIICSLFACLLRFPDS